MLKNKLLIFQLKLEYILLIFMEMIYNFYKYLKEKKNKIYSKKNNKNPKKKLFSIKKPKNKNNN